jgi:hypothetical protein
VLRGLRPDITPAQVTAFAAWVIAQAVAFGWLSTQRSQVILSASATVVAVGWKVADAIIRSGRNRGPVPPPTTPPPSA